MFKHKKVFESPELRDLRQHATLVKKSRITGGRSIERNMAIIEHGKSYGLSPLESVQNIQIKNGVLQVKPEFIMALINRTGELVSLEIEHNSLECKVTMIRKDRSSYTVTFSQIEAATLAVNLTDEYQDTEVRQWGAILKAATFLFPEIMMNYSGFFRKKEVSKLTFASVLASNLLNRIGVGIKTFLEKKRILSSHS